MVVRKYSWWALIATTVLLFLLAGFSSTQKEPPLAHKGQLDLGRWDYLTDGNIELSGEWEFYWLQFVDYPDLPLIQPDLYAKVPGTWNEYQINGKHLPGLGYATYRLHVRTDVPVGTQIGLRPYAFSSAYNLYINDKLVASNGKVAAKASEEIGEYKPQVVLFDTPAKEFDIIIHVSNLTTLKAAFGTAWR